MRRLFAALLLCVWPGIVAAQSIGGPLDQGIVQSSVLVFEFETVFARSAFGQRVTREIEEESAALSTENRQIEDELTAEEQQLTNQRATLSAENFRALADAFDEKVQRLRREQVAKARDVSARPEEARRQFVALMQPVLRELMRETGAAVILERRAVFAAVAAIDVTDLAVARIDARIGDGLEQADQSGETPDQP